MAFLFKKKSTAKQRPVSVGVPVSEKPTRVTEEKFPAEVRAWPVDDSQQRSLLYTAVHKWEKLRRCLRDFWTQDWKTSGVGTDVDNLEEGELTAGLMLKLLEELTEIYRGVFANMPKDVRDEVLTSDFFAGLANPNATWLADLQTRGDVAHCLYLSSKEMTDLYSRFIKEGSVQLDSLDEQSMDSFRAGLSEETDVGQCYCRIKARFECDAVKKFVKGKAKAGTIRLGDHVTILDAVYLYLVQNDVVNRVEAAMFCVGETMADDLAEIDRLSKELRTTNLNFYMQLHNAFRYCESLRTYFSAGSNQLVLRDLDKIVAKSDEFVFMEKALQQLPQIGKVRLTLRRLVAENTTLVKLQQPTGGKKSKAANTDKITRTERIIDDAVDDLKTNITALELHVYRLVCGAVDQDEDIDEARTRLELAFEKGTQHYASLLWKRHDRVAPLVEAFENVDIPAFQLNRSITQARKLSIFLADRHGALQSFIQNKLEFLIVDDGSGMGYIERNMRYNEDDDTDATQELLAKLDERIAKAKAFQVKELTDLPLPLLR